MNARTPPPPPARRPGAPARAVRGAAARRPPAAAVDWSAMAPPRPTRSLAAFLALSALSVAAGLVSGWAADDFIRAAVNGMGVAPDVPLLELADVPVTYASVSRLLWWFFVTDAALVALLSVLCALGRRRSRTTLLVTLGCNAALVGFGVGDAIAMAPEATWLSVAQVALQGAALVPLYLDPANRWYAWREEQRRRA